VGHFPMRSVISEVGRPLVIRGQFVVPFVWFLFLQTTHARPAKNTKGMVTTGKEPEKGDAPWRAAETALRLSGELSPSLPDTWL